MSARHGASRRRSYGRRDHEMRGRRAGDLPVDLDGPSGWSRGSAWDQTLPGTSGAPGTGRGFAPEARD
ncbi:MAG: hypothetical protein ACKOTZ_09995 [Chloroflexota bacterium]